MSLNLDDKDGEIRRTQSEPLPLDHQRPALTQQFMSIRHQVTFTERRFDPETLPVDLLRVYKQLAADFGDEYALVACFMVRTAVELHRAWHMTLLTSKLLQQVKDKFETRMTWNLGVIALKFRFEDGRFELHRKVPYDYDSEFQDLYMKIAVALIEGHINIHEALIFQTEAKMGKHTARSGKFLRANPGRLVLYPLEAATCAVIFFGGDEADAAVAAICGLATGLVEWFINWLAANYVPDVGVLVDILVGITTGVIGGFFHNQSDYCLAAIFLGTLYWFFYGTAFVIGLLEIIAGELETGVTRFIAVSVKTFVLALGSAIGMQIVMSGNVFDEWTNSHAQCGQIDLDEKWWRIPLYLASSASALGQYRFPIANYWRGLLVQLVGYEVQYQMFKQFAQNHERDFLDTASSNIGGAMAAVAVASMLSYVVDQVGFYYHSRLLQRTQVQSAWGTFVFNMAAGYVRLVNSLGIGRKASLRLLQMEKDLKLQTRELRDPNNPRSEIKLLPEDEAVLVEAIVNAENLNIWSLLMPAVYQLVPGSMIARLWYNAVFPPPLQEVERTIDGTDLVYLDTSANPAADDVFYGLWVVASSLALGILLGFAFVSVCNRITSFALSCLCADSSLTEEEQEEEDARQKRQRFRQQGVMHTMEKDEDPDAEIGDEDCVLFEKESLGERDTTGMRFRPNAATMMIPEDEETAPNFEKTEETPAETSSKDV